MEKMNLFVPTEKPPKPLNKAPIQDTEGNLTFSLDNHTYTLNVNSEEERNTILAQVNSNLEHKWDWFKETTGKEHWTLYNTEMYEVLGSEYLHYKENSNLAPVLPINATSCYSIFSHCKNLTEIVLSNFNTKYVVDMSYMFNYCENIITLDLSDFDTSKVVNMDSMFFKCRKLENLDLSRFNTSHVTNMFAMFKYCNSLVHLDIANFDTSHVTKMGYMFCYCNSLTNLDLFNFDAGQVIEMASMFEYCESLITLNLSKSNANKVTAIPFMFYHCSKLTTIDLSVFDSAPLQPSWTNCMFNILGHCDSLKVVKTSNPKLINHIKKHYPQIQIA